MKFETIRQEVYTTVMKARDAGLVRLSAGNISARTQEGYVAITPSGIKYDVLQPEQIAIVDLHGNPVDAPCKPSSETPMHTAILRHLPEVQAICHTHSMFAITFAMLKLEVPVVNLELYVCGAPVPVAPWACPGTAAAGDITVDIFKSRPGLKVCLLRNHGLVAIGKSLEHAFEMAYNAEVGLRTYYQARQLGQPSIIGAEQIEQIRAVYG